jgi:hypothetical protein
MAQFAAKNIGKLSWILNSLWGLGTDEVKGYRTGSPGNIGWRNLFLGIDIRAP